MSLRRFNPYCRWIFPRLLDRVSSAVAEERLALLRQACGQVLEIGAGTGAGFCCYSEAVDHLIALEPDSAVMALAEQQLGRESQILQSRTELLLADAQEIPLADNSIDTVVCFMVLCSVPDPDKALAEIKRVLKPEGQLLFFEHVLSDSPAIQRWQQRLNPLWHRCAGGCQLNRETAERIEQAGFKLVEYQRYRHSRFPGIVNQLIVGKGVNSS